MDCQEGGLYIALPLFCDLQTAPRPPQYTNLLPHSHIIPSFVIHSFHTKFLRPTIVDSWIGGVHFQCSLTCKYPPSFRNIKISFRIISSAPLPSYRVCTQKLWSIQFYRRGLMIPREPLSTYFETRLTTFHGHFLQFLLQIIDNFVFLVVVLCVYHLRTSFQVYAISI